MCNYLFCGEKRLLGEAGDDDGVHVQLLPQLLIVRQLGCDSSLPLARIKTGGGNLIKALNPGTMNICDV